ncbi:MAG: ATP-binding cassette domain-containing protein [Acidobacteriota bacterium]
MILEVEDLRKYYGSEPGSLSCKLGSRKGRGVVKAVDGVSFRLWRGETLGLVGESGCGKTTLARCILRLVEPSSGRIDFMGEDFLSLSGRLLRARRKHLQAVFQDPYASLNPRMRVEQILAEPLIVHRIGDRKQRRDRIAALLKVVGLDPGCGQLLPAEFSGGQRQRIAIARALAPQPDLIVADEPVSSLDASLQGQMVRLLEDLKSRFRLTLLFISHGLPMVRQVCDRVAVMYRGRLLEVAPARQLFETPLHPYTRLLLESIPEADPRLRRKGPPGRRQAGLAAKGDLVEVERGHWVAEPSY